ncbi:MAG TPA: ankyrin repeat domain-containing protein [Spirochaetota bacterium]|jgi:ankyrin repeat protein|nr:MAG: Ankyrin repeats (3 copies) [Spirochaetes bacterium ADurb.Bin133]HNZ27610.1 ankyrin repeat domain-containing protein [Spirochaetota bacterium]HPY86469.1 ankyrin repeat domain-containing protein [Spirochaetota bacterium]HQB60068.1 ankyrin repeat domain-containing protein [Spirochaetota bacterium]
MKPIGIVVLVIFIVILIFIFTLGHFSEIKKKETDARYKKLVDDKKYILAKIKMKIELRVITKVVLSQSKKKRIENIENLISICDEEIKKSGLVEEDEIAKYLMSRIPTLDHYALELEEILYYAPNLNYQDSEGKTPLMIACENRKHFIAGDLIKEGADIEIADNEGKTALIYACNAGHFETVDKLLKAGANVKHIDNSGKKMIQQVTSTKDQIRIISRLIEFGAETK